MTIGFILNFWLEELRLGKPLAVEVVVPGGETHFCLADNEREEALLTTPFDGFKMACECCELLDKVLQSFEGGLLHNSVEQDGFNLTSHHFGDDGHFRRDCCHVCAVCELKRIN